MVFNRNVTVLDAFVFLLGRINYTSFEKVSLPPARESLLFRNQNGLKQSLISRYTILRDDGVLHRYDNGWLTMAFYFHGTCVPGNCSISFDPKITRDETRTILHDHFDEEFDKRFVGSHDALDRVPLNCLGPWHQIHSDGHEKLASQALMMGDITLPIYAFKDQYSTFVPMMDVLPNVRLGTTIGHYFLDFVETYGCK